MYFKGLVDILLSPFCMAISPCRSRPHAGHILTGILACQSVGLYLAWEDWVWKRLLQLQGLR